MSIFFGKREAGQSKLTGKVSPPHTHTAPFRFPVPHMHAVRAHTPPVRAGGQVMLYYRVRLERRRCRLSP